ncbi:MAG: TlyA family RNA methyltransferase [Promethearchaeota archaeon]
MKERIDILLVERRLVESRTKAQWLISHGYVNVAGKQILKPGKKVENTLKIELKKNFPYVGRGGIKLEAAIKDFSIIVKGKTCIDVGASVGGFTDCLLKHGASKVYAIDKAFDLLHPSLICEKNKQIIIPMLGVDARNTLNLNEQVDICTIDITFSSLKTILPNIKKILKDNGNIIALVKPIFETEFESNQKFSVIQNYKQLSRILINLIHWCIDNDFFPVNVIKSPILGKEGAIEFFIQIRVKDFGLNVDFNKLIANALE